ncbi:MAG: hypothetical protein GX125_02165 [Bacteroidales bacterium]|jgi:hypothetical protein|nr:hypothetical protein [Bacteroidales bacterium]
MNFGLAIHCMDPKRGRKSYISSETKESHDLQDPALAAEPVRKDVAGDYKDERGIAGNVMLTGRDKKFINVLTNVCRHCM